MLLYRRPLNIKIVALFVITSLFGCGTGRVTGVDENGAYMEEAAWMQPPLD